jgi:phosphatidate phosphatase PAH1
MRYVALVALLCACEVRTGDDPPDAPPTTGDPLLRCAMPPAAGLPTEWRHTSSSIIVAAGSPHHRGIDLITTTDAATQTIEAKLTYGPTDKDLQDEYVDLFACSDNAWLPIGTALTDTDGKIAHVLDGDARLGPGLRDLFVSVSGDRTGARFLAYVDAPGSPIVVTDVDGTLTASENAYPESLALGGTVDAQPDAAAAFRATSARGAQVIYISARGDRFTQDTRDWFAANGFPLGPVRLPTSIITIPGDDTIEFKTTALASVAAFSLRAGVGNRATDIAAYTNAGLTPDRIFIKLPEFESEVAADLAAGKATGVISYADIIQSL